MGGRAYALASQTAQAVWSRGKFGKIGAGDIFARDVGRLVETELVVSNQQRA